MIVYMNIRTFCALFLPILLASCGEDPRQTMIVGNWEGITILEEGDSLPVDPSEITFTFSPEGSYEYRSTLNYREAGYYQLNNRFLRTTDTLDEARPEKTVEITQLTADTLFLRMRDHDKERLLKLVKN